MKADFLQVGLPQPQPDSEITTNVSEGAPLQWIYADPLERIRARQPQIIERAQQIQQKHGDPIQGLANIWDSLAAESRAWDRAGRWLRFRVYLCEALAELGEIFGDAAGLLWPEVWERLVAEEQERCLNH